MEKEFILENVEESVLYPDIEPYAVYHLDVDHGHRIYVEESGNPEGIPLVYLHGGPGGHCKPQHRCLFDPTVYRIILFDQRGAGQSIPKASIENNTTYHLINDMEQLRQYLNIEKWVVFGASWGSTLALLYAQQHPENVLGLLLRSIFLATQRELDWVIKPDGVARIFPKQWQTFMDFAPAEYRYSPLTYYYQCLTGEDETLRQHATLNLATWTGCLVSFAQFVDPLSFSDELLQEIKIELHYVTHRYFIEEQQILNNINKLQNIQGIIIHGQQDLLCPLDGAYLLHQAWKNTRLDIVPTGGHLGSVPGMAKAVVKAAQDMAEMI